MLSLVKTTAGALTAQAKKSTLQLMSVRSQKNRNDKEKK
jgi:hypothetical protein